MTMFHFVIAGGRLTAARRTELEQSHPEASSRTATSASAEYFGTRR
jgi:hypothetical protein